LVWGTLSEDELQSEVVSLAQKFAQTPFAMTMEAKSGDSSTSHWLFTSLPGNRNRDVSLLQVATPYLRDVVVKAIANIDAEKQVSFYNEASRLPYFRSAF
jgi:hypothetical protein